jgi:hypothetical protein
MYGTVLSGNEAFTQSQKMNNVPAIDAAMKSLLDSVT